MVLALLFSLPWITTGGAARWPSKLIQLTCLWSAAGGFHGNWADDTLDPEYTYYGLLALGHLAL